MSWTLVRAKSRATRGRLGCAWVSTIEQNPARQKAAPFDAGVQRMWLDRASGKNLDACPELGGMLDHARDGDEPVVTSRDRIER